MSFLFHIKLKSSSECRLAIMLTLHIYLYRVKNSYKLISMEIKFWEQNADQWNQTLESGLFKNRSTTNQAVLNRLKQHNPDSLLDIGCGEGWLARHLNSANTKYTANFLKQDGLFIIQTLHPQNLNRYHDGWITEDFKTSPAQLISSMKWYGRTLHSWIKLFTVCNLNLKKIIFKLKLALIHFKK